MVIVKFNRTDAEHVEKVKEEMKTLGAPVIRAVWLEAYNAWQALEGSHRIEAARQLGLTPRIIEVEYEDRNIDGDYETVNIASVCDQTYERINRRLDVEFDEDEEF